MALMLNGAGVSRGIAIGPCLVIRRDELEVLEYAIPRALIDDEVARFEYAIKKAQQQLNQVRQQIPVDTSPEISAFIDTHLLMIEDDALCRVPINLIRRQQYNAEWALKLQRDALVTVFDVMDDPYLKTRRDDVDHVVKRIQRILLSHQEQADDAIFQRARGCVVVADELSPADMLLMYQRGVAGFISEDGAPNSHTAILARSLGVPAVVGVPDACRYVLQNEQLIVDSRFGTAIASPDDSALTFYRHCIKHDQSRIVALKMLKGLPAVSRDGCAIHLMMNIELADEIELNKKMDADGVGLFRTEMLFMNRTELPDEEEQYQIYAKLMRAFKGCPVTIRTLDVGADKHINVNSLNDYSGSNPALGLRAIRLSFKEPQLFLPQLRAILRASALGELRMMVPMLSGMREVQQLYRLIRMCKAVLKEKGQRFDVAMKVGAMIEVPAAAIAASAFARAFDFLSIGTNDLIQYTLATDRMDAAVGHLYDPLHPAVLHLIQMTIAAGEQHGTPVSMCGEMAGDPEYTALLLGMGLREFSMAASMLLEVKDIINDSDVSLLSRQVSALLDLDNPDEVIAAVGALGKA
ncbi:MAG: phosphoenolpyruvate--protein phosphotransferase [Gammaproteobacteria bacterium]|nr:phosphoenolpyruvate--protein phosphotransferase [Gammaproteobacteria bacterium]